MREAIDLILLVKDSGNENRERKGAKEDEKYSASDENGRVWLAQVLTLFEQHISIVFDLFSLEMSQIRIAYTESVHILSLQLVNFFCQILQLAVFLFDFLIGVHNANHEIFFLF